MYCQLKYMKHRYLTLFKNSSKMEMFLSFIGSILIYLAFINIFSDKIMSYIGIMCFLIPFVILYVKGIKYCKEE